MKTFSKMPVWMRSVLVLSGVIAACVMAPSTYAASTQRAQLMKGIRPLGMGGAFLAVSGSDENALFYNPAAIHDYEKKLHATFLSPSVDVGTGSIGFVNDLRDLGDDIDDAGSDSAKSTVFGNFTSANFGRVENYRVSVPLALFMHQYFAVGLIADSETQVRLDDPSFDAFKLVSRNDMGLMAGTSWGWFNDQLETGIALKALYRAFSRETITRRDAVVQDDFNDAYNIGYGFGVGVDLGLKYRLPEVGVLKVLKPALALTYQDIGNTRFTGGDVEDKAQSVSAGFSLNPKIGPLETTFAFDVRDLNHRADFITMMHAGYEVRFPEFLKTKASLRVGTNQGYLTGGLTLDWRYVKLSGVIYGEEIGDVSRVDERQRFGAQLAFGF